MDVLLRFLATLWRGLRGEARPRPAPASRPASAAPAPRREPRVAAAEVFTPTRPRAGRRPLVGRQRELAAILQAITEESAHVVLYSERGRGKTSLANLAAEHLRRAGLVVARTSCDAASTFDTILRGLMRDVPASFLAVPDAGGEGCEALLPNRPLLPADVADIPAGLSCPRLVLLVDEFDRVTDPATRTMLADTVKLLSDRAAPLHFMVVGVAGTLQQILGQHPSIERNIAALHLPLLSDGEIAELLRRGGTAVGIAFTDAACAAVSGVARGMPYMAQLMGLRITQAAVARGGAETSPPDTHSAIDRLLTDAPSDIVGLYAQLTAGPDGAEMHRALLDLAQAPQDGWGRITQPHTVSGPVVERLIEAQVLRRPQGAPSLLEPVDRRLNYHVLLLAAASPAEEMARAPAGRMADMRRAAR